MGRIVAVATEPWGQEFSVNENMSAIIGNFTVEVTTHSENACAGEHCPLHNPSNHPLRDVDMVLRLDKGGLIERLCEHGVGHDDPDSVDWLHGHGEAWAGVHGCDGCCSGTSFG